MIKLTSPDDPLNRITLIRLRELARCIGRSPETVRHWVRQGRFPRPMVARPGSPLQWRPRDIENWIVARRRARGTKPKPRGKLKQYGGDK
jgi:predicted DNA-binding transcriptional regulator AlpA